MKKAGVWILCFLMMAAGSQARAAGGKSIVMQPRTGEYAGRQFYTNSHALVVGIKRYQYLPKDKWLNYADQDAIDLRDMLIRSYGFPAENVTVLLNEQATRANIESALSGMSDDAAVSPDDRVLVYFSGHGQTVKLSDGGDMGFIIPYDADVDLEHPKNRVGYLRSCLPMDLVWQYLEASPAKHRLLLADACYGGLLIKKGLEEKPGASVVADLLTRPAMQAIAAGGKGQEVYEDPTLGHGAFTYKLLEELRARAALPDNVFLTSQLANALKISVGNLTNALQTPQYGNYHDTEGEFIFLSTNPQTVPPLDLHQANPGPVTPPGPITPPDTGPDLPPIVLSHKPFPKWALPDSGPIQPPIAPVRPASVNPKDGADLIYIPAGEFIMGAADFPDAPVHKVKLDGYSIYKNLVTVAMYRKFCEAKKSQGRQMPKAPAWGWKDDHPIVNVTWEDAKAYADWANAALPTEAEWEKAARGPDGLRFPWGNDFDSGRLWCSKAADGDAKSTAPVGSFPDGKSPYGVLDMAGNVWQWCADWYSASYYKNALSTNPAGPGFGTARSPRGGSWNYKDEYDFRSAVRNYYTPDYSLDSHGFRCVVRAGSP